MHWHLNDSHCFKVKLLDLQAAEMQLAEMKFHLHAFDWTLDLGPWTLDVDALLTPTPVRYHTVVLGTVVYCYQVCYVAVSLLYQ
jgi:hypothetical protein